jgi:hypothetical protein
MSVIDLKDALNMFTEGVQSLALTQAFADAQSKVQQARTSIAEGSKQRQKLGEIAQELTFKMAGLGATAASIDQAARSVMPPAPKTLEEMTAQAVRDGDQTTLNSIGKAERILGERQAIQIEGRIKAEERKFQTMQARELQQNMLKELRKAQTAYNKTDLDINKSINQAKNAIRVLESKGDVGDLAAGSIGTMLARASGEVGNLTEAERSVFAGKQDIYSRIKRDLSVKGYSKLPDSDKQALKELAGIYVSRGEELRQGYADTLAQQYTQAFPDSTDVDTALQKITGGKFKQSVQSQRQQVESTPVGQQMGLGKYFTPMKR